MKHHLIPVLVTVLDCLNSLLVGWIQLTHPLICPHCSSQEVKPWGSYQRLWYVPYFDYDYRWRVKRLRCRACQRTFSRYTKTIRRWEKNGKIICQRTAGNHRRITDAEIRRIKRLKESGKW